MTKSTNFKINDTEYFLKPLTAGQRAQSRSIYNRAFHQARKDGCYLRAKLIDEAKESGVWGEEKSKRVEEIEAEMAAINKTLDEGGVELDEAKKQALQMIMLRSEMVNMNMEFTIIDAHTAERQAESAQEDYEVSVMLHCVATGKPYCTSLDDFYAKDYDEVIQAAITTKNMGDHITNKEFLSELPEYKFLKEFGFMDDEFRLIGEESESDGAEADKPKERKPFLSNGKPVKPKKEPVSG